MLCFFLCAFLFFLCAFLFFFSVHFAFLSHYWDNLFSSIVFCFFSVHFCFFLCAFCIFVPSLGQLIFVYCALFFSLCILHFCPIIGTTYFRLLCRLGGGVSLSVLFLPLTGGIEGGFQFRCKSTTKKRNDQESRSAERENLTLFQKNH